MPHALVVLPATAWTWADSVVAAVLAACLATMSALLAVRAAGPGGRVTPGPAVGGALVAALAMTLLTHGQTAVRLAVVAAVIVLTVAVVLRRPGRGVPGR